METERLYLAPVTVDDSELMLAVWNDPAFIRNVADRGIRTVAQARAAIESGAQKLFEDYGYGPYSIALKSDGSLIGICGLFKRDNLDHPDIGFCVLPDYCGKGYAGEAAAAVVKHAQHELGIRELAAIVSPSNAPSIGLIRKLGLRFERMITMPGDDHAICLYSRTLTAGKDTMKIDTTGTTDWRKLREFAAVELDHSFILSWQFQSETLQIDIDARLSPEHPFYEKPRPAEKVCIRPAIIEFPYCDGLSVDGDPSASIADAVKGLGHGAIVGLQRHEDGRYEINGAFGTVFIAADRPILRLKGP